MKEMFVIKYKSEDVAKGSSGLLRIDFDKKRVNVFYW